VLKFIHDKRGGTLIYMDLRLCGMTSSVLG